MRRSLIEMGLARSAALLHVSCCSTMGPVIHLKDGAQDMDDDRREDAASVAPQSKMPPPRDRRLWRVPLLCLLLGVTAVVALLASGLPQRRLIPKAARQVLGAEVSMAVRSTWTRVELGDILVSEPNAPELPPLIRAESVSMPWAFSGPRHFPSLCVTGLEINLNGCDPQRPNYGWIKRFMAQPPSGWNLLPYTPANVTVAPIRLAASLPGGTFTVEGTGAGGLVLTAVMDSMQQYKVGLVGDDAEIRWTLPGIPQQIFTKNGIRMQVEATATGYAAAVDLRLPKGTGFREPSTSLLKARKAWRRWRSKTRHCASRFGRNSRRRSCLFPFASLRRNVPPCRRSCAAPLSDGAWKSWTCNRASKD